MENLAYKIRIIKGDRYDCQQNVYADGMVVLARYLPHEGHSLYRIKATYAKSLKPSDYYVIAASRREARRIITSKFTWLSHISSIELLESHQEKQILENSEHYIVI